MQICVRPHPAYCAPCSTDPALVLLTWAAALFALFAWSPCLVTQDWVPLDQLDNRGDAGRALGRRDAVAASTPLRVVEIAFATLRHDDPDRDRGRAAAAAQAPAGGDLRGRRHGRDLAGRRPVLKLLVGRGRPDVAGLDRPADDQVVPLGARLLDHRLRRRSWSCWSSCWYAAPACARAASTPVVVLVVVVCLDRVLLGRHYPTDVVGGFLLGAGWSLLGLAVYSPLPRSHAEQRRAAARGRALRAPARGRAQPDQGRGRRPVPRDRERDGRRGRLVASRPGTTRPSRTPAPAWPRRPRSPAPTWCSCAAATARCARCAPSSRAPASRSGSSPPAPATCWPATSTSRSTCAPRSTSRSTARTAPSTWSSVSGDGIEDTHFMVMAGMGFDAAIMEGVNEDIKKRRSAGSPTCSRR